MMNKTRTLVRSGWNGCKCCVPVPPAKTTRTREARVWKRDQNVT